MARIAQTGSQESAVKSLEGGRTPPANVEAERALLGAVLLDENILSNVLEHCVESDFFREGHQFIFRAVCAAYSRSEPIDPLTVSEELKKDGLLDRAGGLSYISGLVDDVPSISSVEHYAKIISTKSTIRRLIYAADEIRANGYEEDLDPVEYVDQAEKLIFDILDARQDNSTIHIRDALKMTIDKVKDLFERKAGLTGVASGFQKLDAITNGLQGSDLIILAARPAMGKTSFAITVATNAATQEGKAVAVFSLEMGADQLVMRMLASEARIELQKLRSGFLSDNDWPRLANAAQRLAEARIYIDETPAITPFELRSRARRLALEGPLDLIVVDYLQLMTIGRRLDSREQQISEISRSLKALAKELHIPVIALSQLNRGVEGRTDKRPLLSDLRESGAIEQDADIIMFIYRDEVYNPETEDKGVGEVIIGKHRNGPTGTVRVKFFNSFTRFDNLHEGG